VAEHEHGGFAELMDSVKARAPTGLDWARRTAAIPDCRVSDLTLDDS
jgi:hypothetical protein